jgi:transposase
VNKVVLSHPAKNRIIADAQIKNDRVDAHALATLLRGDFVAKVHVPCRDVRQRKNVIRQRLWLARLRTMIRNRIHTVVDRHPQLERPAVKDLFSNQGKAWMKRAPLPVADRTRESLDLIDLKRDNGRQNLADSGQRLQPHRQWAPGVVCDNDRLQGINLRLQ